jgi:hypothetical protein
MHANPRWLRHSSDRNLQISAITQEHLEDTCYYIEGPEQNARLDRSIVLRHHSVVVVISQTTFDVTGPPNSADCATRQTNRGAHLDRFA